MRSSDLQGKRVCTADGRSLGHVDEIHVRDSEVTALTCGARGLLQRFISSRRGHRVPWAKVVRVTEKEITVEMSGP
jgi:sporulation protein YlmC with PRC-barrel domain